MSAITSTFFSFFFYFFFILIMFLIRFFSTFLLVFVLNICVLCLFVHLLFESFILFDTYFDIIPLFIFCLLVIFPPERALQMLIKRSIICIDVFVQTFLSLPLLIEFVVVLFFFFFWGGGERINDYLSQLNFKQYE